MNEYANYIIEVLRAKQNSKKAIWLENYVKHGIKSFGVGIPTIRESLKEFEINSQLSKLSVEKQIEFLDGLMKNEYTEPKLAAILFIQLYWKTKNGDKILKVSTNWFNYKWIIDWNVCDWLCVRLLTPLLDKEPELVVSVLREWNKSQNLWKARASLVPFAQSKNLANHSKTILKFSDVLIKRQERFCNTAVGWVMREYSKIDTQFVTGFLDHYKEWITKEVMKNATKYMRQK